MVNKAIIVGRLGKDVEVRYTPDGLMIASFSVATDESWKGKDGEKKKKTEWHNVTAFGKLAEICGKYLVKGMMVYVEGKITTDKYDDKEGITRYATKIIAGDMRMLSEKKADAPKPEPEQPPVDDSDVPF